MSFSIILAAEKYLFLLLKQNNPLFVPQTMIIIFTNTMITVVGSFHVGTVDHSSKFLKPSLNKAP